MASRDGDDDEEEHEEEENDGAEQAIAAHLYWLKVIDDVVDEPREWQAGGRRKHNMELVSLVISGTGMSMIFFLINGY